MPDRYVAAVMLQPVGKPLGNIDRAMAAAGAADGDGKIRFALALVARQQRLQPGAELIEQRRKIRISRDVLADRAVLARQRLQSGDVMRIAQEAHIEDEIRIARQALAERERGDEDA